MREFLLTPLWELRVRRVLPQNPGGGRERKTPGRVIAAGRPRGGDVRWD